MLPTITIFKECIEVERKYTRKDSEIVYSKSIKIDYPLNFIYNEHHVTTIINDRPVTFVRCKNTSNGSIGYFIFYKSRKKYKFSDFVELRKNNRYRLKRLINLPVITCIGVNKNNPEEVVLWSKNNDRIQQLYFNKKADSKWLLCEKRNIKYKGSIDVDVVKNTLRLNLN